ncbi:MAG: ABC transporter ATP-binding protein [Clostridiales bacterium]|nr:ABC transporter ATP-binding protein [Clostridiales bacterium]
MTIGFLIKFAGTLMDLSLPWIFAYMIDTIIPRNSVTEILKWGGAMLIASILAVTFNIVANRKASKVARDATEQIRYDVFEKIAYLSNSKIDYFTKPSLISRITTDTYNIHQMIGRIQRLGVRAPILLIGGILITLTLDPILTLVLIILLPFISFIMLYVSKKSIPMYRDLQEFIDKLVRIVREDISGIRIIKALSKTEYEKNKFNVINTEVIYQEKKTSMLMAGLSPIINIILNTGLVLVIIVGAYRVNTGATEVGKILAFMTYFTLISTAMMSISKMFVITSKAVASGNRIMEIIDSTEDIFPQMFEQEVSDYFIEFDQVSFSYNKVEDNVTDLSFQLKKGETLGIIGETGSGKTTIINLLMRFYDVDKGMISIDGLNIKSYEIKELREKFGVVFQNDVLFEDSIYENIRLGRELSEEQIEKAIEYARAKEFVDESENGSSNKLNIKGANLSGGQKQRILIARALAASPDILILDDSSSALDYKTDAALRKEIGTHFKDTTTIIIAQRVSSIMNADHIIVLEDGKIIGFGNHEELIENCEIYKEICVSQMGGE